MSSVDANRGETTAVRRRRGTAFAWGGVLVGPAAWVVQLYGNWTMGEVIACAPASRPGGQILGVEVALFAAIFNAVLIVLTVVSGLLALRELRALRGSKDETTGQRATWLASAGVMTSALFTIVIATSFLPLALAGRC